MSSFDNHKSAQECSIIIPVYKRYEIIRSILKIFSKQDHVEYIKEINQLFEEITRQSLSGASVFFTKDDKFTFRKFISILIGLIGVLFIIDFNTLSLPSIFIFGL